MMGCPTFKGNLVGEREIFSETRLRVLILKKRCSVHVFLFVQKVWFTIYAFRVVFKLPKSER